MERETGKAPATLRRWRIGLAARIRAYFLAGVLVTAPIGITIYLAWLVVAYVDDVVARFLPERYNPETYLPFSVPGLGLLIAFALVTLIGAFAAGYVGRLVLRVSEAVFVRTPFLRGIYGAIKQMLETVLSQKSTAFREVVLVEFPRTDMWSIAFLTGARLDAAQSTRSGELVGVFVPTTPMPTSGYLVYLPESQIVRMPMSIEEGLKLVLSGGLVVPPTLPQPDRHQPAPVQPAAPQPERT
ncbi:putative membrane protein [Stella humosa]|uniref:Putative membrane protein n=1 Tax=Stella humosa TaxID=94 RepID=A0A3N1KVD0_9PROT|nr:DUF502 domain-containing protein [Stella humosa]ROP81275.1 putative membrane protein [Stella humosa]BBK32624.1 membrane protein [Stella humosa]